MTVPLIATEDRKFTLYAIRKDQHGALIQINVPWDRLMEDIVLPFDNDEMFLSMVQR
jgi:hypothetical protein